MTVEKYLDMILKIFLEAVLEIFGFNLSLLGFEKKKTQQ